MSQEFTKSKSSQILANANLLKKYHANVVYDYTEYPTKGNWKESFSPCHRMCASRKSSYIDSVLS